MVKNLLHINFLTLKFASSIYREACIMDDNPENDRIILKNSVILFLFMPDNVNSIDGIENSINPLNMKDNSLLISFDIMADGIVKIVIIPNILIRVIKEKDIVSFNSLTKTRFVSLFFMVSIVVL